MNSKILIIFVLFLSCKKHKEDFSTIKVIGHAITGLYNYHALYPENTNEALEYAFAFEDLAGVEIDIQLSKDNTIWAFHDSELQQRTNGNGRLCERTDTELKKIGYSGLGNYRITKLSEMNFSHSSTNKKLVFLDVKFFCGVEGVAEVLAENLFELKDKWSDFVDFVVIMNSEVVLDALINILPAEVEYYRDVNSVEQALTIHPNYSGVFIRNSVVDEDDVSLIQDTGKKVILFEVRAPKSVRSAMLKKPDMVMPEDFKVALIEKK